MEFKEIKKDIYKLNIPFEDGFTSVFALKNGDRWLLLDAASTDDDGKNHILPALKKMEIYPEYIIGSHLHEDHFGGIKILADTFSKALVSVFSESFVMEGKNIHYLKDNELLLDRYKILLLMGHTEDSIGILDTKSNILVSTDCLQLYGIGIYGTGLALAGEYIKTLEKLRKLNLEGIITSHDYYPLGSTAFGGDMVAKYLDTCADALNLIIKTIEENTSSTPDEIANIYNSSYPELPLISGWTVENVINYLKQK